MSPAAVFYGINCCHARLYAIAFCGVSLSNNQATNICPVCGNPLTIGVSQRVEQLATRNAAKAIQNVQSFKYVLPLPYVFAELLNIKADVPVKTASVANEYTKAISHFGNEFDILHSVPLEDIHRYHHKLSVAIERLRKNQKHFTTG